MISFLGACLPEEAVLFSSSLSSFFLFWISFFSSCPQYLLLILLTVNKGVESSHYSWSLHSGRCFIIYSKLCTLLCSSLGGQFYINNLPPKTAAKKPFLSLSPPLYSVFSPYLSTLVHSLCKYYHSTLLLLCPWLASVLSFCMPLLWLCLLHRGEKQLKEKTLAVVKFCSLLVMLLRCKQA